MHLGWPNDIDRGLAIFALDQHMISYYERQDLAEIRSFQHIYLNRLLKHISSQSSFWYERLGTDEVDFLSQYAALPELSRTDYRKSIHAAGGALELPKAHGRVIENSTSGSSGVPVRFYTTAFAARLNGAHFSYDRLRQGLDQSALLARIVAKVPPHDGPHVETPAAAIANRTVELHRKSNQFSVEQHAKWIAEVRPDYIFANVRLLVGVLEAYESGRVTPPDRVVKALLTFAETVTNETRATARRVLGARIIDRYSCEEAGPLAFQCPVSDDHLHIAETNAIVEVVDDHSRAVGAGQTGRVLVTSLHNYASPVVRYELGDLTAWEPSCVCGYQKPVLTRLLGRTRFLIKLPSGDRKHITLTARDWLKVADFTETRIVQTSNTHIRAEYVADFELSLQQRVKLIDILKQEISHDLKFDVVRVKAIDWGPSYKKQDVISLI